MRKDIRVVIGANFGDEGKGLMTDYFCSHFPKNEKVLNVRFNGTCQAGHTVVKGKKRHVFSHFGSGSFNENVVTVFSDDNKKYLSTDLMKHEPVKADFISPKIELTGLNVI